MLDYAANAVAYWPVEEIKAKFESRCNNDGDDPDAELVELLGEGRDVLTETSLWGPPRQHQSHPHVKLLEAESGRAPGDQNGTQPAARDSTNSRPLSVRNTAIGFQ